MNIDIDVYNMTTYTYPDYLDFRCVPNLMMLIVKLQQLERTVHLDRAVNSLTDCYNLLRIHIYAVAGISCPYSSSTPEWDESKNPVVIIHDDISVDVGLLKKLSRMSNDGRKFEDLYNSMATVLQKRLTYLDPLSSVLNMTITHSNNTIWCSGIEEVIQSN